MGRAMAAVIGGVTAAGEDLKTSWPELVGWDAIPGSLKIHTERPDVVLEFYTVGDKVAPGYDDHRVRIFQTPGTFKIAQTPVVG